MGPTLTTVVGAVFSFWLLWCPGILRPKSPDCNDCLVQRPEQYKEKSGSAEEQQSIDGLRHLAAKKAAEAAMLERKQTSRDFAKAIQLLQESARLFRSGHWIPGEADAYLRIGEIYFDTSQYIQALNSYDRVLKLVGSDDNQRCQALSWMARTYANKGDNDEGLKYSKSAISFCEPLGPKSQAESLEAYGEALYWSGDLEHAAEALAQARTIFVSAKDVDGQALALLMLAETYFRTDPRKSLRLAEEARGLWSDSGNRYGVARVRAFMSSLSAIAGEYDLAQCNGSEAQRVLHEVGDTDSAAAVLTTLGFISMQTGDTENALRHRRQARTDFAAAQDWLGEAEAITGMGIALKAMGRYRQLLPLYQEKLRLGEKTRNPNLVASAWGDIAGVYEFERQYATAEQLYLRSIEGYRHAQNRSGEGTFLIRLAHLYVRQKKYQQAIALLEQALPLKEKASQVEELAQIGFELAYVYRALGRLEDAQAAMQRTVGIIESQRLKMAAFDSRASYFASVHSYYALYIQILMLLDQHNPQRGYAAQAFEASEKSKVRSLLDSLADSGRDTNCDELLKAQDNMGDSTSPLSAGQEDSSPAGATAALALDQVQAEIIGSHTVLLEYALGDEKSYLWIIDGAKVSSHELPGASQLKYLVQGLNRALEAWQSKPGETAAEYEAQIARAKNEYREYSRKLARVLLSPVPLNQAQRLIIVPDGPLRYVPFAALPAPDRKDGGTIVASHHEVVMLPSASVLSAIRERVHGRPPPTLIAAAFGNPVFEPDDARIQTSGTDTRQNTGHDQNVAAILRDVDATSTFIPPLTQSHRELLAVQSLGPKGVLAAEGFAATRQNALNSNLGRYRFLHFATHALNDLPRPERSALILSLRDRNAKRLDGYLRLTDIYNLKLAADLVVLSSCDSGLGKDLDSEGIIGLQSAFLRAGAKSVIATLWKVQDQPTAELMEYFYKRIKRGETPSAALRGAQLDLRREEQWADPYYWAAFVLEGDYK